jgi:hypothetical protein
LEINAVRSFRWKSVLLCFAAALLAAISAQRAPAAIIANGGFESPVINANTFQNVTPTSWTGGALLGNGIPEPLFPGPQEGNQYEDIGNTNAQALSQEFSILAGGAFTLSWFDNTAEVANFITSPYTVSITDSAAALVAFHSFDAYHQGLDDWQLKSFDASLSPGSYELTFTATGAPLRLDTLIDNVSLSPASAAVPEPASLLAWSCLGVVGVIAGRRRRRGVQACPGQIPLVESRAIHTLPRPAEPGG